MMASTPLHGIDFEEFLAADEEIVFGQQAHKIEIELSRSGLDPETHIGHVAGNIGRHRRVREFDLLIAVDLRAVDLCCTSN